MGVSDVSRQAFLFFRTNIDAVRLIFTDVTPAQIMTEEATNDDPWGPHSSKMFSICQASFEPDDYWRILEVIKNRLCVLDDKNTREYSKTLELIDYMLTHGPHRFAHDLRCEMRDILLQLMEFIQQSHSRRLIERKISRILELLERKELLEFERNRRRKLSFEIRKGSLSCNDLSSPSAISADQESESSNSSVASDTINDDRFLSDSSTTDMDEEHISNEQIMEHEHPLCNSDQCHSFTDFNWSNVVNKGEGHDMEKVYEDCYSPLSALRRRKKVI